MQGSAQNQIAVGICMPCQLQMLVPELPAAFQVIIGEFINKKVVHGIQVFYVCDFTSNITKLSMPDSLKTTILWNKPKLEYKHEDGIVKVHRAALAKPIV